MNLFISEYFYRKYLGLKHICCKVMKLNNDVCIQTIPIVVKVHFVFFYGLDFLISFFI